MKETVGSPGPFQPFHAFIHGVLAGMFFLPSRLETRVVGPKGQSERLVFIGLPPSSPSSPSLPMAGDYRRRKGGEEAQAKNKYPGPPPSFSVSFHWGGEEGEGLCLSYHTHLISFMSFVFWVGHVLYYNPWVPNPEDYIKESAW